MRVTDKKSARRSAPPKRLMTQKEYAQHRGVSPAYISKLVRDGRIVLDATGRVQRSKADAILGRPGEPHQRQPRAAAPAPVSRFRESGATTLTAARARKALADAKVAELDAEERASNLLPRSEVIEAQRRQNANVRTRLRRLPRQLAPMLAPITSPAEIERLILEAVDRELAEMAIDPLSIPPESVPEQIASQGAA